MSLFPSVENSMMNRFMGRWLRTTCDRVHQTMRCSAWQAVVLSACALTSFAAGANRFTEQLAAESHALVDAAIRQPYGWGWRESIEPDQRDRRPVISMDPTDTPAAGLMLLWAGELLKEPRFTEAAVSAARGVAASQEKTGKIPSRPVFASTAGGRDTATAVPDRATTRAGLALLLAVIGADESRDEQFHRAALRASTWLLRQQTGDGGWPVAFPPDATRENSIRMLRLDLPDYRDSTLALFLAAEAFPDTPAGRAASKAVAKLLSLRLTAPKRLADLWATAYHLNGALVEGNESIRLGADVLGSRLALQTLLAACVLNRDAEAAKALDSAAKALVGLRNQNGTWQRLYLFDLPSNPATQPETSVLDPTTQPHPLAASGDFGLGPTLESVQNYLQLGGDEFESRLGDGILPRQSIALTLVGLLDQPLEADWPGTRVEAVAYIERHAERWRSLESPPPSAAAARTRRLFALALLVKLEATFPDVTSEASVAKVRE
jgi:hypothetical protein